MKTMDDIRSECIARLSKLIEARKALHDGIGTIEYAGDAVQRAWQGWGGDTLLRQEAWIKGKREGFDALHYFMEREAEKLSDDISAAATQAAFLIARDVILPLIEDSEFPIVVLTSNNYVPALRSFDDIETIYQADDNGDVWERFVEAFEGKCDDFGIQLIYPEDDNCVHAVGKGWWYNGPDSDDIEDFYNPANWKKK